MVLLITRGLLISSREYDQIKAHDSTLESASGRAAALPPSSSIEGKSKGYFAAKCIFQFHNA